MIKIRIKPLSINDAFQGRRFKTKLYKAYDQELDLKLPKFKVSNKDNLKLDIEVGFSNSCSDLSNIIKPFEDALQKKYGFNDNHIYEINMIKKIVKKGEEYISFSIESILA